VEILFTEAECSEGSGLTIPCGGKNEAHGGEAETGGDARGETGQTQAGEEGPGEVREKNSPACCGSRENQGVAEDSQKAEILTDRRKCPRRESKPTKC
jgi:hypothetical protein